MSAWAWALVVFQFVILAYFAVLNFLYALFGYLGLRAVIVYARELSNVALRNILERELEMPVSILVPAHNEEGGIVASLRVLERLTAGRAALDRAADGLESGMPIEAVLVDLRDALLELERVLGIDADDAVLDRIFATFCVGK